MRRLLTAFCATVFALAAVGSVSVGCDSDTCESTCDTDEDCGDGYICYSDGICDNEDHDCGAEAK